MMLASCKRDGHKIITKIDDTGYDEKCETCGAHAHLCKPMFKKGDDE